ncbi:lysophospholipid acyltransferase family protein [Bdellovibrionota bacterium FG-1]
MESPVVGTLVLFFLRAIAWFYYFQPRQLKRLFGRALGSLLRRLSIRAKIVEQNLLYAFPDSAQKREELFRESYVHFGNLIFEVLLLLGPMKRFIQKNADLSGIEYWRDAKKQGKGVIFLASHLGNWEVMAAAGAFLGGIDLLMVTKHLKPEWLHQAIESGRRKLGVEATYEPRTLKDVLRHLKRNGTIGFVLDQYAGPPVGVRVPVFGIPVGTSTAIAALAKRTGAVVLSVVNYRSLDGRWKVEIGPPVEWQQVDRPQQGGIAENSTYELALNTASYSARLEKDIYTHPGQWLWTHRRFKGDLQPLRPGEWYEGRARA